MPSKHTSRRKRDSNAPRPELARPNQVAARPPSAATPRGMGEWNWKTFPVFFAFSLGGFLGLYLGVVTGTTGNRWFTIVVFSAFAMLLGWGLSRILVRWLVHRKLVKPRAARL